MLSEGLWLSGRKQGAPRGGEMCPCFGDGREKRRENAQDTWEGVRCSWGTSWAVHGELCAPEHCAINAESRRADGSVSFALQCKMDLGGGFPAQAL